MWLFYHDTTTLDGNLTICYLRHLLVLCNVTNKIRKRTDTAVAFTQKVFQDIVSTDKREYAIYGFRLIQGHTRRCGKDRREDFLDLESMPRRRDHVAVILRATGFD